MIGCGYAEIVPVEAVLTGMGYVNSLHAYPDHKSRTRIDHRSLFFARATYETTQIATDSEVTNS